ncbi:conserved protein of unknown function [Acidithiobacillus ferrivorans]|uniref:Uncharacterized protein n=1 Tax=Acidithiobacillus ferrivorans TaxID=160808 RepID=A0A060UL87_9PROT|nr:hypothetical protein AFERRI_30073 [Acidithiobacillus ferrivorans]SMH67324.1 conserved protein of unknown function [Acidithiobacillus ferrivorans]
MLQYGVDDTQGVLLANATFLAESGEDHPEISEEMTGIVATGNPFPEGLVGLQTGKGRRLEDRRFGGLWRQRCCRHGALLHKRVALSLPASPRGGKAFRRSARRPLR